MPDYDFDGRNLTPANRQNDAERLQELIRDRQAKNDNDLINTHAPNKSLVNDGVSLGTNPETGNSKIDTGNGGIIETKRNTNAETVGDKVITKTGFPVSESEHKPSPPTPIVTPTVTNTVASVAPAEVMFLVLDRNPNNGMTDVWICDNNAVETKICTIKIRQQLGSIYNNSTPSNYAALITNLGNGKFYIYIYNEFDNQLYVITNGKNTAYTLIGYTPLSYDSNGSSIYVNNYAFFLGTAFIIIKNTTTQNANVISQTKDGLTENLIGKFQGNAIYTGVPGDAYGYAVVVSFNNSGMLNSPASTDTASNPVKVLNVVYNSSGDGIQGDPSIPTTFNEQDYFNMGIILAINGKNQLKLNIIQSATHGNTSYYGIMDYLLSLTINGIVFSTVSVKTSSVPITGANQDQPTQTFIVNYNNQNISKLYKQNAYLEGSLTLVNNNQNQSQKSIFPKFGLPYQFLNTLWVNNYSFNAVTSDNGTSYGNGFTNYLYFASGQDDLLNGIATKKFNLVNDTVYFWDDYQFDINTISKPPDITIYKMNNTTKLYSKLKTISPDFGEKTKKLGFVDMSYYPV